MWFGSRVRGEEPRTGKKLMQTPVSLLQWAFYSFYSNLLPNGYISLRQQPQILFSNFLLCQTQKAWNWDQPGKGWAHVQTIQDNTQKGSDCNKITYRTQENRKELAETRRLQMSHNSLLERQNFPAIRPRLRVWVWEESFSKAEDLQPSRQEVIKTQANILTESRTREGGVLGMLRKWWGES